MARLRYNGLTATLGLELTSSAADIEFDGPLTHSGGIDVPTIVGGDEIPMTIRDAAGRVAEIVSLTAYTAGATTGTITRAQESTTAKDHASGMRVTHGLTVADMDATADELSAHEADTSNPHAVTKAQVGLGDVPNVDTTNASNITTGTLPNSVVPPLAISETFPVASQAAMLALTAQRGDVAIRSDLNKSFILSTDSPSTLADWKELLTPTDAVTSVAGKVGVVTLVKGDVGLGDVDNTSDAAKPVSTAQQAALDAKAPISKPAWIAPFYPPLASGDGAVPTGANNAQFVKLSSITKSGTYVGARLEVTVQSGNLDVGLYELVGTDLVRRASVGGVACPAVGASSLDFSASYGVLPGSDYYLAISADDATAKFRAMTGVSGPMLDVVGTNVDGKLCYGSDAGGMYPLPATVATGGLVADSKIFALILR